MIKNRKLTLEQRIARLENAVKANSRGTRKFEDVNLARDLENELDKQLGEFYNINVVAKGNRLIADVDDGEPEWSTGGTFEVVPTKVYYEVNVLDGAEEQLYELGTANDMEDVAELIAEEIEHWAMDL